MTITTKELTGHTIVCGFGRVGQITAAELAHLGAVCLIVDDDPARIVAADVLHYLTLRGDATLDATLEAAGVRNASALAALLPDDALNLFITLTARNANSELRIVARAEERASEDKLRQAGADEVILPASIGGLRIAHEIAPPDALGLLDVDELNALGRELSQIGVTVDAYHVDAECSLDGVSIHQLQASAGGGFLVVALARPDGTFMRHPVMDCKLRIDDRILMLGHEPCAAALLRAYGMKGSRTVHYHGGRSTRP